MDNMLYIIVGLVIIAGIAFVVMRGKNKPSPSQTPASQQPSNTPNQRTQNTKSAAPEPVTKFDNETVAQRFIDQQRYDKAIETIDRGLAANPADSALLLKLLHVYKATEQTDAFYQTYAKLETHADPVTMVQAQQLKAEVDREHTPMDTVPTTHSPSAAVVEDNQNFSDFNFEVEEDTPVAPVANTQPERSEPTVTAQQPTETAQQSDESAFDLFLEDSKQTATDSPTTPEPQVAQAATTPVSSAEPEDDFSFTLDGLEASLEPETTSTPVQPTPERQEEAPAFGISEPEPTLDIQSTTADTAPVSEQNLSADFGIEDSAPVASEPSVPAQDTTPSVDNTDSNATHASVDDDFSLDFDSLLNDPSSDASDNDATLTEAATPSDIETATETDFTPAAQSPVDTDLHIDVDPTQVAPTIPAAVQAAPEDIQQDNKHDDFADFNLFETQTASATEETESATSSNDDISFDDDNALSLDIDNVDDNIDFGLSETQAVEDSTPVANETPAAESEDEQLLFDDDFDFDAFESTTLGMPVADDTAPVEAAPTTETAPADTSLLPPADDEFDFVKNLDSNQVTLELAEQYLNIGEYDGAKHLLKEVLAQGNSEQQQQAHRLLARTA